MKTPDHDLDILATAMSEHTDITLADLAAIGLALMNKIGSVAILGWASPGNSLDYASPSDNPHAQIVQDFTAWTSGRKSLAPGCEERLRAFIDTTGWTRHQAAESSKRLGLDEFFSA